MADLKTSKAAFDWPCIKILIISENIDSKEIKKLANQNKMHDVKINKFGIK